MAPQRAGKKRKLVEIPRPEPEIAEESLDNGDANGTLEDEGEIEAEYSLEDSSSDEEDLDDDDDDESIDSDEIPSSESEEEEHVRDLMRELKTYERAKTPPAKLMGSETAKDVATLSPQSRMKPLIVDEQDDSPDFRIEVDANGNERYVYTEIEPGYASDDSDAPPTTNTIGNIPLSYYGAFPHIGYDINGKRIARPAKGEALDSLLDSIDLPAGWTGLTDPNTGKPMKLNREELEVLKKLTRNEVPGDGYDPYPDMVEYFTGKGMEEQMPISAAPEPKRRFVPSMHEHKRVMKMVKAIKDGRIKPYREPDEAEREREEQELEFASYDVWADEAPRPDHVMNVPAPKLPPPGYEESYHPPPEYLPDKREKEEWEKQDEEDRTRDFLPQDHSALRKVAAYPRFVSEKMNRCLDLYLAPRVRRSKLNIDPESLLPKLPDPSELKPFPSATALVYRGHEGRMRSAAMDPSNRFLASGGDDGTVRVWAVRDGRQIFRAKLSSESPVNVVAWRPGMDAIILAACCGEHVHFVVPELLCHPELYNHSLEILDAGFGYSANGSTALKTADGKDKASPATWSRPPTKFQEKTSTLLTLTLRSAPKTLVFHRRGDYFSTVTPGTSATSTAVAIHTLSKNLTQHPFKRLRGLAQTTAFHSTRPTFFVATRQSVRVYDLRQQKLEKELQPGARWISSISLHPMGSDLLISSYDKRLLYRDLDLGKTPYKTLRYHSKAIRSVAWHPNASNVPLFVDASDDGTLQVFHGKVDSDGLSNATVVPLKVLRGHRVVRDLGVLDVGWHGREAWCFSAGADGGVRLWT